MARPFKFGGADGDAYQYPNVWTRQPHSRGERLVIAPASGHVDIMLELASTLEQPLGMLWVLVMPRMDARPGRYQSPTPLSFEDTESFVRTFGEFLERDGRHHFWVMSAFGEGQVIYDNHNVLYFYGDLDRAAGILRARGLAEGERPRFPVPHSHCYNREYDGEESRMMGWWAWVRFPLVEEHDDP